MAIQTSKSCSLVVNTVDLSDHVTEARLEAGAEMIDVTALGATDTGRIFIPGLKTWTLNVTFQQDYAANKVDATLSAMLGGSPVTITLKPATGSTSATNPEWSGSFVLESYTPVGNRVGELQTTEAVFRPAGAITRSTT